MTVETGELGTRTVLPVRIKLLLCENVGTALEETMYVSSGDLGKEKRGTQALMIVHRRAFTYLARKRHHDGNSGMDASRMKYAAEKDDDKTGVRRQGAA